MSLDPALLLDILLAAQDTVDFSQGMEREMFLEDRRT